MAPLKLSTAWNDQSVNHSGSRVPDSGLPNNLFGPAREAVRAGLDKWTGRLGPRACTSNVEASRESPPHRPRKALKPAFAGHGRMMAKGGTSCRQSTRRPQIIRRPLRVGEVWPDCAKRILSQASFRAARTGVSVPSVVKGKVSNRQDPTGVEFTDAGRAGLNHPADALAIGTPCLIPSTDLLLLQKGSFDPRLCPKPKNRHIPRSSGLPLRKSTARRKFRHRERSTSPSAPFVGQIQPPSSNSFLANTSICPGTHDRGFPSIHCRRRRAPTTAAAGR